MKQHTFFFLDGSSMIINSELEMVCCFDPKKFVSSIVHWNGTQSTFEFYYVYYLRKHSPTINRKMLAFIKKLYNVKYMSDWELMCINKRFNP